jgi:hypothetical protein
VDREHLISNRIMDKGKLFFKMGKTLRPMDIQQKSNVLAYTRKAYTGAEA